LILAEVAFKMIQEWKDATTAAATAMLIASAAASSNAGMSTNEGATASIQSLAYHPDKPSNTSNSAKQHHSSKRAKDEYKREATGEEEIKIVEKKERKSSLRRRSHHNTTDHDQNHTRSTSSRHATDLAPSSSHSTSTKPKAKLGFWLDSWNLIQSNHVLQILFVEAVAHQICTNMLNIMFHNGLRSYMLDDTWKAKLVGRFFSAVNITSSSLQCFVLPILLSQQSLPTILNYLPVIVLIPLSFGLIQPGLIAVMLSFGTMKVLEYSIMHSASELIYMPLGQEVRYVGKELIKFFGHKLGKSFASLILSVLIAKLSPSLWVQILWGAIFAMIWGIVLMKLSTILVDIHAEHDRKELSSSQSKSQTELDSACAENNKHIVVMNSATSSTSQLGYMADAGSSGTSNISSRASPHTFTHNESSSQPRLEGSMNTPHSSSASLQYENDSMIKSPAIHAPISTANLLLSSKRAAANTMNTRRKPFVSNNAGNNGNEYSHVQRPYQPVRLHTSTSMPLFAHFAGDQRKRGMKYAAGVASPRYPSSSGKDPRDGFYQGEIQSSMSMTSLASTANSGGGISHVTSQSSLFEISMDDLRSIDTASTTTMTTVSTTAFANVREEDEYAVNFEDHTTSPSSTREKRASSADELLFTGSFDDEKAFVVMQSPNSGVIVTTSSALIQKKKEHGNDEKKQKLKEMNSKRRKGIEGREGGEGSGNESSSQSGIFIEYLQETEEQQVENVEQHQGANNEEDADSIFDCGMMIDEEEPILKGKRLVVSEEAYHNNNNL
jgi:hypothetical protein